LRPSADVFQPETPPGHRWFVANKSQTHIRPSGHRAVEALSSRFYQRESVPISGEVCFPMTRDVGDDPIPAILRCPTRGAVKLLLKTKAKVPFDKTVIRLSRPLLPLLSALFVFICRSCRNACPGFAARVCLSIPVITNCGNAGNLSSHFTPLPNYPFTKSF
jgi:hypothetical protein